MTHSCIQGHTNSTIKLSRADICLEDSLARNEFAGKRHAKLQEKHTHSRKYKLCSPYRTTPTWSPFAAAVDLAFSMYLRDQQWGNKAYRQAAYCQRSAAHKSLSGQVIADRTKGEIGVVAV